jgi:O-antigen/teichoic acid export membrane protein
MDITQRIGKNTSLLYVSQLISYIFTFFYTIYVARFLGADGYGILSFALAFSGILSILADLGLSTLTVREVSRDKSLTMKYLGNVLVIKMLLGLISFGIIVVLINILGYPQITVNVVYLISLSVILTSICGIFYSIFQAHEKMEFQSFGQILNSILMFFGVLIVIYLDSTVVMVSFIYLISSIITLCYVFIMCLWKFSIPKMKLNWKFWKITLKESLPFGITGISVMTYTYVDSVLLSLFKGNEVVGWYTAAYKLVLFLVFIPTTINITIFPSMSKFHISSQESLKLLNEKYFKFMLIIGIPIGIGTTLLAEKIIFLIFGAGYTESVIALKILIWTIIFTFGGAAFVRLLEATNKQFILAKITGISVLINILLNLILIPEFSFIGASISTVLTEMFLIVSVFRISFKLGYGISLKKILNILLKITFASFIMCLFIIYLINWNLVFLVLLSFLTYFSTFVIIKGFDDDDIIIIKQLFHR